MSSGISKVNYLSRNKVRLLPGFTLSRPGPEEDEEPERGGVPPWRAGRCGVLHGAGPPQTTRSRDLCGDRCFQMVFPCPGIGDAVAGGANLTCAGG